jgi:hypothetical protein
VRATRGGGWDQLVPDGSLVAQSVGAMVRIPRSSVQQDLSDDKLSYTIVPLARRLWSKSKTFGNTWRRLHRRDFERTVLGEPSRRSQELGNYSTSTSRVEYSC